MEPGDNMGFPPEVAESMVILVKISAYIPDYSK